MGVAVRRTWLALVLLAAIFSMHGISALPGDAGTSVGTSSAHSAMDVAADGVALGPATPSVVVDHSSGGSGAPTHGDPAGHGMTGHLWSLCLAVLLAGAALFLIVRIRRTVPVERALSDLRRVRAPEGLVGILRPPDLSALCLLRI